MSDLVRRLCVVLLGVVGAMLCLAWSHVSLHAQDTSGADVAFVLRTRQGGHLEGVWRDSSRGDALSFHARGFQQPFDFDWNSIANIRSTETKGAVVHGFETPDDFFCELVDGDRFMGTLKQLTESELVLEVVDAGQLHLDTRRIRRIWPSTGGNEQIYAGPNGLAEWTQNESSAWRDEGGHLVAQQRAATISANLGVASSVCVEVELSWVDKPNFSLALGIDPGAEKVLNAFCLETWDSQLVMLHESSEASAMAKIQEVDATKGRLQLTIFLDQQRGRAEIYANGNKFLAKLETTTKDLSTQPGVRLTDQNGGLRLERLHVTRWNGELPAATQNSDAVTRIWRTNRSVVSGQVQSYDPTSRAFVMQTAEGVVTVPIQEFASLEFTSPKPKEPSDAPITTPDFWVRCWDGCRLVGQVKRVADGRIEMSVPGVTENVVITRGRIEALVRMDSVPRADGQQVADGESPPDSGGASEDKNHRPGALSGKGRPGSLVLDSGSLTGCLVDGPGADGASCLVWHPQESYTASSMLPGVSGRVVYRETVTPVAATAPKRDSRAKRRVLMGGGFIGGLVQALGAASPPAVSPAPNSTPAGPSGSAIYLRSGDTFPCELQAIDEAGVTFQSPATEVTFLPHEAIQAVRLGRVTTTLALTKAKRDRLLTVPRMQRDSPPTHLLQAVNGDLLRTRIIAMDAEALTIEVRLKNQQVPRDQVASITWLHPPAADKQDSPSQGPADWLVQAVRSDGTRFTYKPIEVRDGVISGTSDVLLKCSNRVEDLDQLRIGAACATEEIMAAHNLWTLIPASDPQFVTTQDAADGGGDALASPLVGQPAPAIELDQLGGEKFTLESQKGSIVVLDFWASWCGPCMQWLPQVEGVVDEFRDRGVKLVAVNLQEEAQTIDTTLDRLGVHPIVVLDQDGTVAMAYQAQAIPQTVVIDQQGRVTHVFVGAGEEMAAQLHQAINGLLSNQAGKEAEPGNE